MSEEQEQTEKKVSEGTPEKGVTSETKKKASEGSSEKAEPSEAEKKGEGKPSPLDEAKKVLAQITEQNKLLAANLEKSKTLAAEALIAGRALAGQAQTQDQKDTQAARDLLGDSGYAEELFPK